MLTSRTGSMCLGRPKEKRTSRYLIGSRSNICKLGWQTQLNGFILHSSEKQAWRGGMKPVHPWRWESTQDTGLWEQQLDRSNLLTPLQWITRPRRNETTQTIQKMGNNSKKQKQNFKTLHCLFACMYVCRAPTEIRGQAWVPGINLGESISHTEPFH